MAAIAKQMRLLKDFLAELWTSRFFLQAGQMDASSEICAPQYLQNFIFELTLSHSDSGQEYRSLHRLQR